MAAKWTGRSGKAQADAKTMPALERSFGTTPAATRAPRGPPSGLDFGTGFWDAEGPDFRASRACPETVCETRRPEHGARPPDVSAL
jgi:hypothetical protein